MKAHSGAGISGKFRFVAHNVAGLRGSGPDGAVTFDDLWARDPSKNGAGELRGLHPERVKFDVESNNKILKRGLAFILYRALSGHPTVGTLSDITFDPTDRPFEAFFAMADEPIDGKLADKRVEWNESDGQFDAAVPVNKGNAGTGLRATLVTSDEGGTDLKRTAVAYPTTSPYRELEYTLFMQATSGILYSNGSVTVDSVNLPADGKIMTLNDGVNPAVTFEFRATGSVTPGNVLIDTSGSPTDATLRDRIIDAVNGEANRLNINATNGGAAIVGLTHTTGGAIGDQTIVEDFLPLGTWGKVNLSGGSAAETGLRQIDNLPIKSVGLAAGVACGDGEVDSQIGVRSVIGLAPTVQGYSDRIYEHEGTGLHAYTGSDTVGVNGDGYHQSGNEEETDRSIAADASFDGIDATDDSITMKNGAFTDADIGRALDVSGSASNNNRHTIDTVVNRYKVTVAENITVTEGGGFTADVIDANGGEHCFDGDIESEVDTGLVAHGDKWRSVDGTGPHDIARAWATSKAIHGIRVIHPAGIPKDNCLHTFKVQKLATVAQGNPSGPAAENDLEPANDNHWIDIGAEVDFTVSGQADNIFDGGERGYEFLFNVAHTTRGIRITSAQAFDALKAVEIAEIHMFSERAAITFTDGVDDAMRFATDGVPSGGSPGPEGTYKTFDMGDLTTTGDVSQNDMQSVADWLNKQIRGFELEAIRSEFGFLWIRATVAGDNAQLDVDSLANGSTAMTKLGLGSAVIQRDGTTQTVLKLPGDAMTILYRVNLSGDLPVAA
jgi:hypothetical protein